MSLKNIALLVFILIVGLQAASVNWIGTSGKWSDDASWDSGIAPTGVDDVTIPSTGSVNIDTAGGVAANTVTVNSGGELNITTKLTTFQIENYGDVVVLEGGVLTGNGSDPAARYWGYGSSSVFYVAGTVEVNIDADYGQTEVWATGVVNGTFSVTNTASIAPNAVISHLVVTGTVTFIASDVDGEAVIVDSLESTSGNLVIEEGVYVNVTNNFNTSSTDINGAGWLNLGEGSIQAWDYVYIYDNVTVNNHGWLESGTSSYFIYLYNNGVFNNYGTLYANAGIEFYDTTTTFGNWGEITSTVDDGTNSYVCVFYNYGSSSTASPNVTNHETGNITCVVLRLNYIKLDNQGSINVEEIDLSGNADDTVITINEDQQSLRLTGTGSIIFVGDRIIESLTTEGSYITIKNQDGNTTINHYLGNNSRNTWTSGPGNWFILGLTFETDYTEDLEDAWLIFEDNSNQTSKATWTLTRSTVYSRGHFQHSGSYFYFADDNSTFINQGYFECLSSFYATTTGSAGIGAFISVGVIKFVNGATFYVHAAVCNGGLAILSDSEDNYFDTVAVYTYERVSFQGSLELEFGPGLGKDFELSYQSLWYWSSAASKYPDEYNSDGIPRTFTDQSDYDVEVRPASDGTDPEDYSDVEPCWTTNGLYGYSSSKDRDANSLCEDQPNDLTEGICGERELPDSTVDIETPTTGSASNMIFSVLSVLIIAAFLTLF